MANPEHVEILKQGVEVWNKWRKDNPDIIPNLSSGFVLSLDFDNPVQAHVDLSRTDLSGVDLSGADLRGANLSRVDLSGADLSGANLSGAGFNRANLSGADLMGANLMAADFIFTDLSNASIDNAICLNTIFSYLDLSTTTGLEKVIHEGPSTLGMDTYFLSKGKLPEIFLKGCGLPETLITYLPSMLESAIQFYSCFISYSHDDRPFAKLLHDRLQGQGIRCWLDEHQFKPGDELHKTIYEGIRVYDKVILCCSESSLKSWWVEKEFKNAISKEEDYTEPILIPLSVDRYIYNQSADNWTVGEIKRRFVQDFSNWKDHDAFEAAFKKVVAALRTDGGKPPPPTSKLTRR